RRDRECPDVALHVWGVFNDPWWGPRPLDRHRHVPLAERGEEVRLVPRCRRGVRRVVLESEVGEELDALDGLGGIDRRDPLLPFLRGDLTAVAPHPRVEAEFAGAGDGKWRDVAVRLVEGRNGIFDLLP